MEPWGPRGARAPPGSADRTTPEADRIYQKISENQNMKAMIKNKKRKLQKNNSGEKTARQNHFFQQSTQGLFSPPEFSDCHF